VIYYGITKLSRTTCISKKIPTAANVQIAKLVVLWHPDKEEGTFPLKTQIWGFTFGELGEFRKAVIIEHFQQNIAKI
jgi:hypothetical protein